MHRLFVPIFIFLLSTGFETRAADVAAVTEDSVLRLFPDSASEKLVDLAPGAAVKVLSRASGWVLVEWSRGAKTFKGWIEENKIQTSANSREKGSSLSAAADDSETGVSKDELYRISSDPTRSFYFPTALQQKRGKTHIRGFYLLGWHLEKAFFDNTSFGFAFATPIGVLGGGPTFKQTFELAPKFHVALGGGVGGVISLIELDHRSWTLAYMGGAMATWGDEEVAVTVGGSILGARWEKYASRNDYGHTILGDTNFHYRINRTIKAMVDVAIPIRTDKESIFGDVTLVNYGIRIGGEHLGGDVGFLIPIHKDMGQFMKYFPLGFPIASISYHW